MLQGAGHGPHHDHWWVAWNITADPHDALMVDMIPVHERPVFSAILNIVSLIGQVGIVVYVNVASLRKQALTVYVVAILSAALCAIRSAAWAHGTAAGESL